MADIQNNQHGEEPNENELHASQDTGDAMAEGATGDARRHAEHEAEHESEHDGESDESGEVEAGIETAALVSFEALEGEADLPILPVRAIDDDEPEDDEAEASDDDDADEDEDEDEDAEESEEDADAEAEDADLAAADGDETAECRNHGRESAQSAEDENRHA